MIQTDYKICIISHTHLCRNPRALKEAIALAKIGYNVEVLNSVYDTNLLAEDKNLVKNYPIKLNHVSDLSVKNFTSFCDRLIKKTADFFVKYLRIETRYALGYAPNRYLKKALAIKAHLYICHQELPLYLGIKLSQKGFKTAFDIEDWHSEDLMPNVRKSKAIRLLKKTEKFALGKGAYCSTTSHALAKKLSETYKTHIPEVIYNVFDIELPKLKQPDTGILKLVWFSQHIGKGRGIEEFINIFHHVHHSIELHLIGDIGHSYKSSLIAQMPQQHKIIFHEIMPTEQLDKALKKFDIGLAIELNQPASRDLTITNKFFQYIQNGLPVIATDTNGQKEIFDVNKPGIMINFNAVDYENINLFLSSNQQLTQAKNMAVKTAEEYNWNIESLKLIKLVENALQ